MTLSAPKYISSHKHTSLYVRRLDSTAHELLLSELKNGEVLYALFDIRKSVEEFLAEKSQLESLSPSDIAYGATPSILKTVFMRIDSRVEFERQPWRDSGWVWFYAVPDWYAYEPTL